MVIFLVVGEVQEWEVGREVLEGGEWRRRSRWRKSLAAIKVESGGAEEQEEGNAQRVIERDGAARNFRG